MSGSASFVGAGPVILGGFVFQGFEVPEVVRWGGQQMLHVHQLVGGERVIDAMGPSDIDITWAGILLSADAANRADTLNQMRVSGLAYPLVILDRFYTVVVRSFQADQRKINHVPFKICCTVQQDRSSVPPPPPPPPLEAVSDDLGTVYLIEPPPPLIPVQAAIYPATVTLANQADLVAGTAAAISVSAAIIAAQAARGAAALAADVTLTTLAGAATAASVLGTAGSAEASAAALNSAVTTALTAATAAQMDAYLARSAANMGNL